MATANLRSIRLDPATYQIDCRLDYTLDSDCDFIFMIHVAQTPRQRVLDESLRLSPAVRARLSHDPAGHRLLRLRAAPGPVCKVPIVALTADAFADTRQRVLAAGVVPEIEIFDSGDLQMALHFVERGILHGPLAWQIVLGVRFGAMADPQTMMYFASRLPRGAPCYERS